jgi:hypothetical protein
MTAETPGGPSGSESPAAAPELARADAILALALVGSRAPAFNHDLASKLQGLLITLEELAETLGARGDAELGQLAADGLALATEVVETLTAFRALTRAQPPAPHGLRELIERAAARVGVTLVGELASLEVSVMVAAPAATQALALALDAAAGPGRGREVAIAGRLRGARVEIAIQVARVPARAASEHLALAAAAIARDGGELQCSPPELRVWLVPAGARAG